MNSAGLWTRFHISLQIPLVPLIPCLSIFCNITLMMKLNYLTWIRLAIWLVIGTNLIEVYGLSNPHMQCCILLPNTCSDNKLNFIV